MNSDNKRLYKKGKETLDNIMYDLTTNSYYYECDISSEYTLFEECVKDYCDLYIPIYLKNNDNKLAFKSIKSIIETVTNINSDMFYENFFRPIELLTYYLGKIIYNSNGALKNKIYHWIINYIEEHEYSFIVQEYLKPFIEGIPIYHADSYYTNYNDFKKMTLIYKS